MARFKKPTEAGLASGRLVLISSTVRITVLTWVEHDDPVPDRVVGDVVEALRANGHEVDVLARHGDLRSLVRALDQRRPDLVFNLMEMFGDDVRAEVSIAGVLELLGVPHTGGGPGDLYVTQDKAIAKKVLRFDGIRTPDFAVFYEDADLETAGKLRMPLFVKPLRADASIGIDEGALVHSSADLMKRVVFIHEECGDAALVEEYIDGRELYVGVLGNRDPIVLPPLEMDFSRLEDGAPRVLDQSSKDETSGRYHATRSRPAELSEELLARVQDVSRRAYRALRVRDYGRVDLRVTPSNEIYVLEVNANCYLARHDEFARAARRHGIEYPDLVQRIVDLAAERHAGLQPGSPAAPPPEPPNPPG